MSKTTAVGVLTMLGYLALGPAMADGPAVRHGLWVWKGAEIVEAPRGPERLRDFCRTYGVNEVYVSLFSHGDLSDVAAVSALVALLHPLNVRVEALLSSTDADEAGPHREKLLDHVRAIVRFNSQHPASRIDGIHLDIEPQQRKENKGAGNLRFLPGLVEAFRAVRALAEASGLSVNADIQNKLLKGSLDERRALMQSMPRLTLMLYELSSADDGTSSDQKAQKLRAASQEFLTMAYQGLPGPGSATLIIGLRTPDYGELLPQMLKTLDDANATNPHYQGSARHSYNDALKEPP
jgi:hypothetical protein